MQNLKKTHSNSWETIYIDEFNPDNRLIVSRVSFGSLKYWSITHTNNCVADINVNVKTIEERDAIVKDIIEKYK